MEGDWEMTGCLQTFGGHCICDCLRKLQAQFGVSLYEDIACMIYDLIDANRQWHNYLENLNLTTVPVFGVPVSTAPPAGGRQSLWWCYKWFGLMYLKLVAKQVVTPKMLTAWYYKPGLKDEISRSFFCTECLVEESVWHYFWNIFGMSGSRIKPMNPT